MADSVIDRERVDPAVEIADAIIDAPAVIFSGQGAQKPGMGRDLAENRSWAMDYWKQAEKISNLPLREIYWEGDEAAMSDTRALQPALTVVNFNMWREFEASRGIIPAAAAGHSLGEFAALAAARVLDPVAALQITAARGRLMAEADLQGAGTMAAIVKLDENTVEAIVREAANESGALVVAANYNTPQQIVISGAKNAVNLAVEKARALKGRAIELKVSGAFHSPMMEEANREFAPVLDKVDWHDPRFPVYTNADAQPAHTGEKAKKSILRQMVSPVFWVNLVRSLYLAGVRWWMEISPRAVLGKMLGPSVAGLTGYLNDLRVELLDSFSSIANYVF